MPQSLIQIPKDAHFKMGSYHVTIQNHHIQYSNGLFNQIMNTIQHSHSNWQQLTEFENHGISWEMVIECCARELEENVDVLAYLIWMYTAWEIKIEYMDDSMEEIKVFMKSDAGGRISDLFIEKIRNCNNWQELYTELHPKSSFQKEMKSRILREVKK